MKHIVTGLLIALALVFALFLFKNHIPSPFSSTYVTGADQSARIDIPVIIRVEGGMLEVASVKGKQNFSGATDPEIFGRAFTLCREKAGLNADYTITYRVKLGEKWAIRYTDGRLIARVPDIEPALPVAFDTTTLTDTAREKCWFLLDLGTRDRVLHGISGKLQELAQADGIKKSVRPDAEKTITEFIRTWAVNQKDYPGIAADAPITVLFPAE